MCRLLRADLDSAQIFKVQPMVVRARVLFGDGIDYGFTDGFSPRQFELSFRLGGISPWAKASTPVTTAVVKAIAAPVHDGSPSANWSTTNTATTTPRSLMATSREALQRMAFPATDWHARM